MAGPSRPTLQVQRIPSAGGFAIRNPAFTNRSTPAMPGCPNRATTSRTRFKKTVRPGYGANRPTQPTGPLRDRGAKVGNRVPGSRVPNRVTNTGVPTNQQDHHTDSSGQDEVPSDGELDDFVNHTDAAVQDYLGC